MSNNIVAKEMFQSALNESTDKGIPTSFLSGHFLYLILGVVFIGIALYFYFNHTKSSTPIAEKDTPVVDESKSDLLKLLEKKPTLADEKKVHSPIAVEEAKKEVPDKKPIIQDTWCFVGEDISGRYCVKVPSKESCVPDRTFRSLSECALIDGNHLPAGIEKDGVKFTPLYSMNIEEK